MSAADHPQLRPDAELVVGFDDEPLLHIASEGRYVRLGRAAAKMVPYLDGSRSVQDLAAGIAGDRAEATEQVQVVVQQLVDSLARAGLLVGTVEPLRTGLRWRLSRTPTKKFPILTAESAARFISPVTKVFDALSPAPVAILVPAVAAILLGATAGVLALGQAVPLRMAWAPLVALAVCLLATAAHEAAHAVVCHLAGHPVRSMGIGLWYYFIPIAYADRTDTYQVRSRVSRVAISLAGPASDMVWCGLAATALLSGAVDPRGFVGQVLQSCIYFFLVGLLGNFNPLLPSDGQQALESALGLVNVRNRAIGYLVAKLPGGDKADLRLASNRIMKVGYLVYGTICCVYLLAVAVMMIWSVTSIFALLMSVG